MAKITYKDAGLDLPLYDQAIEALPAIMRKSHTPRVIDLPGGFAGLFRLKGKSPAKRYKDPVLISGTDGVGTKLKVATMAGVYDTVGIDLVGMSVNDCLCLGAEPLFFLDYLALSKDDPTLVKQLVSGVSAGCVEAGCALLGGETAIHPGTYTAGDFDMAGFCTAVAERRQIIDGHRIKPRDVAIGVASSGFHSNGYSLIRKVVFEAAKLKIDHRVKDLGETVADALLAPTKIYVQPILRLLSKPSRRAAVKGLAHITGGGLADNLVRIFPAGCRLRLDRAAWALPPRFQWLMELGHIDREEAFRVFNMGIGFVVVVKPTAVDEVCAFLEAEGLVTHLLGVVEKGEQAVEYVN